MTRGGSRSEWNDFRLFSLSSARRQTFTLSITANKTVFWIENAPPWESCPPFFGKRHLWAGLPKLHPPSLCVFDELHEIGGLAIQNLTNLIQCLHRQMFHRAGADRGDRGRSDARSFCEFFLRHVAHSKHNLDLELNHKIPPFLRIQDTTNIVLCQYGIRKIFSFFVKEITISVLTNYEFRSNI